MARMKLKPAGIGAILLIGAGIGAAAYFALGGFGSVSGPSLPQISLGPKTTLKGFVGGEKVGFLENPRVQRILGRYGIELDYSKAGSIEMVRDNIAGNADFLWPSSQVALELYRMRNRGQAVKSEIVFNSPIVIYSWQPVAAALEARGLARQEGESTFVSGFPQLVTMIEQEKKWSDIGLNDLYGKISIISTDPTKSNSGNMFSGLLANVMLGDVADAGSIGTVQARLVNFFRRLGYMHPSSGDLFDQYLRMGIGSKPMIVGYENQIVEFSLQHQDLWPKVKDRVAILYPVPTVWSSHPVIALTPGGEKLLEALKDEELQKIAWEQHGFRTGLIGVENDPTVLEIAGIPEDIARVIPMPAPDVMERIIRALGGN